MKLQRGALYGPLDEAQMVQVKRTASSNDYIVVPDKGPSKETKEAKPVDITVKAPIKVSEAHKEKLDIIEDLLQPVKVALAPTHSSVDKTQLPSAIPMAEEAVSLSDYAAEPVMIPQTPRVLQDLVEKNQAAEQEAKVEPKKVKSRKAPEVAEAKTEQPEA